ncbi:MAG: hypothetical protein KJ787_10290 [Gammaproteobacteria bacterium]|nr:hypothetical protein [Gammaproteobacteria bacterium]MBU1646710.1 hypothetical protein [Gammaproteobacteria bacterium]MBU1971743.1 hypothetical protein [Gammaproteobacteria bacterium]
MKTAGWIVLLMALLAPAAWAQPGGGRHGAARQERLFAERPALREQRGDVRNDLRGDTARGESDSDRCDGGPCRMSPEDRRQLRRDIHDAGRDLYRRGPRHRD